MRNDHSDASEPASFPPLEVRCEECSGQGYCPDKCEVCNGSGNALTEFGAEVVGLVSRHLRLACG